MVRAGFWLRWSWRDLRSRWLLVLAIALVIAIGIGIYTGLGSMERWRVASNDASYSSLRAHDLEISLTEGTFADDGELNQLIGSIPDISQVERSGERLILPAQLAVQRSDSAPLLVSGQVVGSSLAANGPAIDGVAAEEGRGLRRSDTGQPTAVLEATFADYHGLAPTGTLRLGGGPPLEYVGQGRSPEYFLLTRPGGGDFGGAEANFGVVFTSLPTAQQMVAGNPVVNDAVLRVKEGADTAAIQAQLETAMRSRGLAGSVTTQADETAHRVLYRDAEGDQQLFNIFAVLILAGAALATFNLATRIVEAQRREIGVGMALGVSPAQLAIRPLLLGVQLALAGTVLGIGIGLLAGDLFRGVLEDLLPLPETRTPFELGVFMRGAALGLILPIVATAIPVWRGVRLRPIDAIRVGFRSARSSGVAALGRRVRLPGSTLSQLPLRNALRAPRRTLMTAVGIGAVVTVIVAFLGFVDSFLATVDRSEAEVAQDAPDRITVTLERFEPIDSAVFAAVQGTRGVEIAEPRLRVVGALESERTRFDASITLINFRSPVWHPTIVRGRAPEAGERGIVISEEAAADLEVEVGDSVSVTHPRRLADGSFTLATTPMTVTGLHPDPFRTFAYVDRSLARAAGVGGVANELAVLPAPGVSDDQVARRLFGTAGVAAVERATATTDFVRDRLDDFVGVLQLTVGFALALALLIAFNSSTISVDERARENATMLAYGVSVPRALALAVGESLVAGVLGTALGLAGGVAVIGWVVNNTLPETLPDLGLIVSLRPGSVLVAALVGVLAVALAPLMTARKIRRMDIPATLRVVE